MTRKGLLWGLGVILVGGGAGAGVIAYTQDRPLSGTEQDIVAHVDENADEAIELLQQTVEINSGTMNAGGVREVGAIFQAKLDALGFDTRWIDPPEGIERAGHLYARRTGNRGKHVLLIGHLDTVFEPTSRFQTFERDGETARGPGVLDMKGGNIVILYALEALASVGALDDTTITVVLTGDEENPGRPLEQSRRELIGAGEEADVALGFEQGMFEEGTHYATVARRSATRWTLTVQGQQGHSSRIFSEEYGAGAAFEAARILNGFYDALHDEENLSFNAGLVLGGTEVDHEGNEDQGSASGKANVIARRVLVQGDLRALSSEQETSARERMTAIVAEHLPGTEAEIEFDEGYPAMSPTEGNAALLAAYSEASVDLGIGPVEAYDPGRRGAADISFVAEHADCLAGLGPYGSGSHSPDEEVNIGSIAIATKRAAILIYRLTRD